MKITRIGSPEIIMSNPFGKHSYFAWPTAVRLQNGRIAVAASGFRLRHICPFGKTVISYSEDDGKTYTLPAPVIDTALDDRDGGIMTFGQSGVLVSSFNNTRAFQRDAHRTFGKWHTPGEYERSYLDIVTDAEEQRYFGSLFRVSLDHGVSFGALHKSPVTSPHGPVELPDGSLLWVGRTFLDGDGKGAEKDCIQAWRIRIDGGAELVGEIENVCIEGKPALSCEPHAIVLKSGDILAHIRVQSQDPRALTIFQTVSKDGGKTWEKPHPLLPLQGGSPPHLLQLSSGVLLCTYGFRASSPYGVRAMLSRDNGETWETDFVLYENEISADLGYPSTVELPSGELLTVFYATPGEGQPAVILQQRWRIEDV